VNFDDLKASKNDMEWTKRKPTNGENPSRRFEEERNKL